jgi:signal transduction histidine kinase
MNTHSQYPRKKGRLISQNLARMSARQLEASATLNSAMRQAESRPQALEILLDQSLQAFSADAAGVYDLKESHLIYTAGRGLSSPPPERVPAGTNSVLCQAMYSDHVLRFETAAASDSDCDFCAFLAYEGMQCLLVTPLRTGPRVVGVLFIALRETIHLSSNDVQLLNVFSEAAGNTLHRFQILEQLEQTVANRERELQLMYDLMVIAGETSEMDQLLQKSLGRILAAADCPIGVIHFIDPATQRLGIAAREQYSEDFDTYLTISGKSELLWGRVYRDQEIVHVQDLPDRSFPERPNPLRQYYTYLGLPIRIKGKVIGALSLFSPSSRLLDPTVAQLLNSAAGELGLAVESTHFRKQAEDAIILRERQRLGRNLHDSVSQSLYALVISADVGEKLLRIKDFPGLRKELQDIGQVALQGLKEMRLLLYEFRPASLENIGVAKALEQRLNTVECRAGIEAALSVEGSINLSPEMEQEIYRIAIEGLNNSLKHSAASSVSVTLRRDAENIELEIRDNGLGFDPLASQTTGGMGLDSMRERARILGGELLITSIPDQGTTIHLTAPLTRPESIKEEHATPIDSRSGG